MSFVGEQLTAFVNDVLLMREPGDAVKSTDDLLMSGILDSIAVMRLIGYIETDLQISVPPEDVTLENFSSIESMSSYLETKSTQGTWL